MNGPEEQWEDRELWKQERRLEPRREEELTKEDIYDIIADEKHDADR